MRLFVILVLVGLIGAFVYIRKPVPPAPTEELTAPGQIAAKQNAQVVIDNQTYFIFWQEIGESLMLIPNFELQRTSSQIMEDSSCAFGANGGFYTTDNTPIGLFVTNETQLSPSVTNATFNGFFLKKTNGGLALTNQVPSGRMEFAVQSGPYMTPTTNLRIKDDEPARRIIVAASKNKWYFLAITQKDNSFSGPPLADVPEILGKLPITINEALNLDGGSASSFYNKAGVRLGELTSVGSFFCGN